MNPSPGEKKITPTLTKEIEPTVIDTKIPMLNQTLAFLGLYNKIGEKGRNIGCRWQVSFFFIVFLIFLLFLGKNNIFAYEEEEEICGFDMSWCEDMGATPQNTCCRDSGGCSTSECGDIDQWNWCHATDCCLITDKERCWEAPYGDDCWIGYRIYFTNTECGATDTCYGSPYLYAGKCSSGGCTVGGRYKVCCYPDGRIDGDCNGGEFTGTCPPGTETKYCGFDGYPDCDDPNVCGGEPAPEPGEPTPTPYPTPPAPTYCDWRECDVMECCDSWIEVDVPESAQIGDIVKVDVYQHPGWGSALCWYDELGTSDDHTHEHLIAYGGMGAEGHWVDWEKVGKYSRSHWNTEGTYKADCMETEYRLRSLDEGTILKEHAQTCKTGQWDLDPVETSDPVGHRWYNTKVARATVYWDTSDIPAGTYNFDNGPFGNIKYGGHDDNCGDNDKCCDEDTTTIGGGYTS
ncbi:MAG: hypothetical protein ACOC6Q_03145, partial [Patescibacteria group bacterium]